MFHEIWAVGLGGYALVDFLAGPGVIAHGHFFDGGGDEGADDGVEGEEVMECGEDLSEFYALEYGGDL